MLRNIDLNEISDGKSLHGQMIWFAPTAEAATAARIVVRVWETPSSSIPMIFISFARGLSLAPEALLDQAVGLSVVDGIILPHLNMTKWKGCLFFPIRGRTLPDSWVPAWFLPSFSSRSDI